jgi:hypothetical protein
MTVCRCTAKGKEKSLFDCLIHLPFDFDFMGIVKSSKSLDLLNFTSIVIAFKDRSAEYFGKAKLTIWKRNGQWQDISFCNPIAGLYP